MNLQLNKDLAKSYSNNSQKIRIMTESWFLENMFCPTCGESKINNFENNRPVADFYCTNCNNQYELKSKNGNFTNKINDGAYKTMIDRITSFENPDLFCLSYSKKTYSINDLIFIPKYFFTPDIIEKRKPLDDTAHRAGWTGCNILINRVPEQGKIKIISNGVMVDKKIIVEQNRKVEKLSTSDISCRSWLLDTLNCMNKINKSTFSLSEMYYFEEELSLKHPRNNNIKPKIRQQLQILRDRGFIEFIGKGEYKKN